MKIIATWLPRICILLLAMCQVATITAAEPTMSLQRIRLITDHGDLVLALYPEVAPQHTRQILRMVEMGIYDTTHFYRIEKGFVAQTSVAQDRLIALTPAQQEVIKKIPAEFSELKHVPGIVSMARDDGDIDSAATSFSILVGAAPHLDGAYTIFGKLVDGQDVLEHFFTLPVDEYNRPRKRLTIHRAIVMEPEG